MDTYETVHTGDVILGGDGQEWGVSEINRETGAVTLTRFGVQTTGYPPAGTPVTVLSRADTIEEARAFAVLQQSFGDVSLVGETWR
jgi:fructose-1,6-bisphosphatase/inositol monophosphatase family enzyme